jgi:hypothetical protein
VVSPVAIRVASMLCGCAGVLVPVLSCLCVMILLSVVFAAGDSASVGLWLNV